jgi:hypothetical protein
LLFYPLTLMKNLNNNLPPENKKRKILRIIVTNGVEKETKKEKGAFDILSSWNPLFFAVASFWGSIVYYVFTISRLNYWQVPIEFISFETKEILQVAVISILVAACLIIAIFLLVSFLDGITALFGDLIETFKALFVVPIESNAKRPFLARVVLILFSRQTFILLIWTLIFYLLYNALSDLEIILNNVVYWGLIIAMLPLIFSRMWKDRTRIYKLLNMSESESGTRVSLLFVVVTALFLVSVVIAFYSGRMSAVSEKAFYVLNTSPECVVLYSKSDRVICATKQTTGSSGTVVYPVFSVWNVTDNKDLEMVLREIGPVTVSKSDLYKGNLHPKISLPTETPSPLPSPSQQARNTQTPAVQMP